MIKIGMMGAVACAALSAAAEVVVLGPEASGTAENPKVYTDIGGKREFTGAKALPREGWKAVPGKPDVRVFDLKSVGVDKLTEIKDTFMVWSAEQLMKDGRPQPLARDPSTGWNRMAGVIDHGTRPLDPKIEEFYHGVRPGAFIYRTDEKKVDPATWDIAKGVWLYGYWGNDWYAQYLKVGSVDPATNGIRLAAVSHYGIGVHGKWENPARRWCAFNSLAFVDAPGEWYIDREEAKIYYIDPKGSYEGLSLAIEKRPLLTLRGVKHVRFRGLVFRETAGSGVSASGCEDVRFEDCKVFSTVGAAMSLSDMKDTWVVRCTVRGSGSSGLSISGGDRRKLIPSGNRVIDCDLGHTGQLSKTSGGQALAVSGVGTLVSGCYIHDTPYIAFNYTGNDHLIVSNEVAFAMLESGDGGALYTGRDWGSQGNVLRDNYIHHLGLDGYDYKVAHGETPDGEPLKVHVQTMGIYLDDCDSGDTIVSNVFYKAGWAVFVGGGRDNKVRDNVMVSCTSASHIDLRGLKRLRLDDTGDASWRLNRGLERLHYKESPWKDRYPWLLNVMENDPMLPIGTEWTGNLSVNCERFLNGYQRPDVKKVVDERLVMRDNRVVTTNDAAAVEMLQTALSRLHFVR